MVIDPASVERLLLRFAVAALAGVATCALWQVTTRSEDASAQLVGVADAAGYDAGPMSPTTDQGAADGGNTGKARDGAIAGTCGNFTAWGDAFERFHCRDPMVLCVNVAGVPLIDERICEIKTGDPSSEDLIPVPEVGDTVYLRVLGTKASVAGEQLLLSADGTLPNVFAYCADAGAEGGQTCASDDGGENIELLGSISAIMPSAPSMTFRYRLVRIDEQNKILRENSWVIKADPNTDFHFEGALLIPFIVNGQRDITAVPTTNGTDQVLHVHQDLRVTVGIGLNYYPFGINGTGPWTTAVHCDQRSWDECSLQYLKTRILKPIGLQAGTTLDFSSSSFREWYLGLAFEPIRGMSLSVGAAFVRGLFFTPGFAEGVLLPPGAMGVPAGATETSYMVRPYFGVTISPEVLTTILGVFTQLQKIDKAKTQAP